MTDRAYIQIVLEDGSGCYVSRWYPDTFSTTDVSNAIDEAAAALKLNFCRDRDRNGPWDPATWLKQHAEKLAAIRNEAVNTARKIESPWALRSDGTCAPQEPFKLPDAS